MNTKEGDIPCGTFNCQFNTLFGEDCHDSDGHLHVCQSKLGMGLVVSYLLKINWTDFPLELKLPLFKILVMMKKTQWQIQGWMYQITPNSHGSVITMPI